jgi:hypothetical protein
VAWNTRGELLPNSFPLPDFINYGPGSPENVRFIVFAGSPGAISIDDVANHGDRFAKTIDIVSSNRPEMGFEVARLDDDSLSVASVIADDMPFATIHCTVWGSRTIPPKGEKPLRAIEFKHVALEPTGSVTTETELDVPSIQTVSRTDVPGSLVGIADPSHPEWGYWRPDGTPLPKIAGVELPRKGSGPHPRGNITRRVGLLFRSREGSTDQVIASDVSGVLICGSANFFHTPSGRYDLDEVFVNPDLTGMRLIAKSPRADVVVARIHLTRIPRPKQSKRVSQFIASRIGPQAVCFGFDRKIAPPGVGHDRSLRFLRADNSTPSLVDVATDWDDGVVAVQTAHPEKIVAANLLEHGYEYFDFPNVALVPRGRR